MFFGQRVGDIRTDTAGSLPGFVAVLGACREGRARVRRLLAGVGLASIDFDSSAALCRSLEDGQKYVMLVLSLAGPVPQAEFELAAVLELASRDVPLMLLMTSFQVELATKVMDNPRSDFLLLPVTDDDLRDRLWLLYANHGQHGLQMKRKVDLP